ncbi:MAG TPA: ABC transporter substrate-binding protein [Acidimicrobiales bacterium]|nr:ABC transporter substrate-binding protein [Acidimicrobiales bacterium]
MDLVTRLRNANSLPVVLVLANVIVVLLLTGVIASLAVGGDDGGGPGPDGPRQELSLTDDETADSAALGDPSVTTPSGDPIGNVAAPGTPGATTKQTTRGGAGGTAGGPTGGGPNIPQTATRTGISSSEIKFALHAPVTFDGAPLNLAEDPIEGVKVYTDYINMKLGGVFGRQLKYQVFDDRYTVPGAGGAANQITDYKPFFVSGTLGVDQVAVVAAAAQQQRIPYMAAGGSEGLFKDIGMFQISASYDSHLEKLAEFLNKERNTAGSPYRGMTKVGVSQLDSKYIDPSVDVFRKALSARGMSLVAVAKVKKPTEQTTYREELLQLREAQIVVPAQDPITTSRMVAECRQQGGCGFKWSFSNFAHESDTALQLMAGEFNGARGLSAGCYYVPSANHNPYDPNPATCGSMGKAHQQWVEINGQSDWEKDGQGGAAGYQIVNFFMKALRDAGTDPTREKFLASLYSYDRYNDLVSGPITFLNSPNIAHGATQMVPFEAGIDKYRQLTAGFVSGF